MDLVIKETDELYPTILDTGLTLMELVVIGINTTRLIKDNSHIYDDDETDSISNDDEPANLTNSNWEILSEIKKIQLTLGGSANKGKIAEETILQNITKFFPDSEINATGYQSGKGDIVMITNGIKLMVEVKNYNINVPTKEQDKFHRDLLSNDYNAAIMISCNSGIAGHKNQFDYKTIGNKFAVYISNAGNDAYSILWAVLFIKSSISLINKISRENKENEELIAVYVENKLKIIKDCIEDNAKMRESIFNMKASIIRTVDNSI